MRRIACFSLLLLVLSATAVSAAFDPNSGILIPEVLGEFSLEGTQNYEADSAGLGYGLGYGTEGIKATVYIYNLGENAIPDGIENKIVEAAFHAAIDDIRQLNAQGVYELTGELQAWKTTIGSGVTLMPVLHAATEYIETRNLVRLQSHLYVFGRKNQIIKLRISNIFDGTDLAEAKRQRFLADVASWLSR